VNVALQSTSMGSLLEECSACRHRKIPQSLAASEEQVSYKYKEPVV